MKYIKYIRKAKAIGLKLKIHVWLPYKLMNFISHYSYLSEFINRQKNIPLNDFYSKSFQYNKREKLHEYIIESEKLNSIDYLEFGVAKGNSIRWWVNKITNPNSNFYGFDTFTGLPEDWGGFKKGAMSNGNKIPEINDSRCFFYQGLFQQTLPDFLKSFQPNNKKVIHLDADLYSSTLYVLTSISPYLKSGDIIMFDEFNVPMHEFKAFKEWLESYYINYEVIGAVNNFYQMAIKII